MGFRRAKSAKHTSWSEAREAQGWKRRPAYAPKITPRVNAAPQFITNTVLGRPALLGRIVQGDAPPWLEQKRQMIPTRNELKVLGLADRNGERPDALMQVDEIRKMHGGRLPVTAFDAMNLDSSKFGARVNDMPLTKRPEARITPAEIGEVKGNTRALVRLWTRHLGMGPNRVDVRP